MRSVVLQQAVTVCDVALRLFSQCGHALSAHFRPKQRALKRSQGDDLQSQDQEKVPIQTNGPR